MSAPYHTTWEIFNVVGQPQARLNGSLLLKAPEKKSKRSKITGSNTKRETKKKNVLPVLHLACSPGLPLADADEAVATLHRNSTKPAAHSPQSAHSAMAKGSK